MVSQFSYSTKLSLKNTAVIAVLNLANERIGC